MIEGGQIVRGRELGPTWQATVDAVVVGVGGAGREALAALATRGLRVIGLDAGPGLAAAANGGRLPRLTVDGSVRLPEGATADEAVLALADAQQLQVRAARLGLSPQALDARLRTVLREHDAAARAGELTALERALQTVAAEIGGGAQHHPLPAIGMRPGEPALHRGLAAGASVVTEARVESLMLRRRRVVGVEGSIVDHARVARLGSFRIEARAVLLCASAIDAVALVQGGGLVARRAVQRVALDVTALVPLCGGPSHDRPGWRTSPVEVVDFPRRLSSSQAPLSVRIGAAAVSWPEIAAATPGHGREHLRRLAPFAEGRALAVTWTGLCVGEVRARGVEDLDVMRLDHPDAKRALAFGLQEAGRLAQQLGVEAALLPVAPPRLFSGASNPERLAEVEEFSGHVPPLRARAARGGLTSGVQEDALVDAAGRFRGADGLWVAGIAALGPEVDWPPLLDVLADGARVGALLGDALR